MLHSRGVYFILIFDITGTLGFCPADGCGSCGGAGGSILELTVWWLCVCVCSVADVNVSLVWKAGSQTAAEMGRFSLHVRKFSALPESPLGIQGWWRSFCVTGESKLKSARWLLSALFHFFPPPLGMCDWLMRAKLVSRGVTWIDAIHTTQSFIEKSETSA